MTNAKSIDPGAIKALGNISRYEITSYLTSDMMVLLPPDNLMIF